MKQKPPIVLRSTLALTVFLLSFILISCEKEEDLSVPKEKSPNQIKEEDKIEIGKQLENPYSVENMQKAYNNLNLSNGRTSGDKIKITTTHLYIKFKPKTEEELDILKKDSTLILFSYPLDHKIIKTGSYYHDPTLPADQPTYQYTSVEVNKKLPVGVSYELLAQLFIPDDNKNQNLSNGKYGSNEEVKALVDEALKITGNLEDESVSNGRIEAIASWRPRGRLIIWDDVTKDNNPVYGVDVRAKRWFTVHTGMSDINGYFTCNGTFDRPADYSIHWEKYDFSVRTGTFGQAECHKTNMQDVWYPALGTYKSATVNHEQQYYALIFQAAYDYYYGNRHGLSSPPRNSAYHPQIKFAADLSSTKSSHTSVMYTRTGGLFPSIRIREWGLNSNDVYSTTVHELAHAAHWDMDREAFRILLLAANSSIYSPMSDIKASEAVFESWATGVEWQFTQYRYRNFIGFDSFEHNKNFQDQTIASERSYTSIVVDMIDFENQRFTRGHNGNVAYPLDNVIGYHILKIEQGLRGARTWNEWRNNMITRHDNFTEGYINELFANWHR